MAEFLRKKLIRITTDSISLDVLLKGQLRFLNDHFEVVALASDKERLIAVAKREEIREIYIKMNREISLLNDFLSLIKLIYVLKKEKPFIVHTNTPKASLLSMVAAKLCMVPNRLYSVTGLRFETVTGGKRFLLILMERITCFCATKVIPEGEGVKKSLLINRITSKPMYVLHNGNIRGVDMKFYARTPDIIETSVEKRKDYNGFVFCYVGRLVKDKGINELVIAFTKLYSIHKNITLVLVGPEEKNLDPLNENTLALIAGHTGIKHVGMQNDVRPYLAASDAFVFPSYREGFPNVVLEAGAMGLPSIVTDINGSNEIIIEGQNGIIIPPMDEGALFQSMKYFIEHKDDEVRFMAGNARKLIETRYEQNDVWEALLEFYKKMD